MSASVWKLRTLTLNLDRPCLMGILNVTPDSFSDGGQFFSPEAAVARAMAIVAEGAELLDIGAESTRPGAEPVAPEAEWDRLRPVLQGLPLKSRIPVSVDTRHPETARRALQEGVEVVNDISCARDPAMLECVAAAGCGYVLMHSRGDPKTMQEMAHYLDVAAEVRAELEAGLERAVSAGVARERICLDPGFGFAKTPAQNWELLERLDAIVAMGRPVLVGISRKRMLRERVGEDPERLLAAGLEAARTAVEAGARLLRVHDVAATRAYLQTLQNPRFYLD